MLHRSLSRTAPLRILVGPHEISGQIPDYAEGFRALGHTVTTVIRETNRFFPDAQYDIVLPANADATVVRKLMDEHDVFVFQYGESLVPGGVDLPVLRAAGKAIIAICNGDDVRHASAYAQEFGVSAETLGEFYMNDPVARPMHTLRLMEWYASLMVSVPNQAGLALRPYMHFAYPLNIDLYQEQIPDRDVPVVVHAPSNRACKGTAQILAALERLRAKGVAFDLRLLENVPNAVVRETLRDADVAIDQLFLSYGKFAAEALASGCATACVTYPEIEPAARERPLWHIDASHLEAQLEQLLTDRALRRTLAAQGRAHAVAKHERSAVCRALLDALFAVLDKTIQYDYTPTFFATAYALPANVDLPAYQRELSAKIARREGLATHMVSMARRGLITTGEGADGTEPLVARFTAQVHVGGDAQRAAAGDLVRQQTVQAIETYLDMGLYPLALQTVLPLAGTHGWARRIAGLLLLGSGQFADAEALLDTLRPEFSTDPLAGYYHAVARLLQGKHDGTADAMREAVSRLPHDPQILLWGSTPIIHKRYWVEAMREGGYDARTLMTEFYASINRREDFDHYTMDFVPAWTEPRYGRLLAPYHAFVFVAMFGKYLHTSFDGGPLQTSAAESVEPQLLQAAGIQTVLTTYGGDGAMYSKIRDLSVRHAFQLSYPDAARREPQIAAKVERWNRYADCIIGNIHSLDGHGRWDLLMGNCAQIDLTRCAPIQEYRNTDGRNGVVRVLHTPNHRGVKGTEFLVVAVEELQREGLQVELVLLEKVQNHEVLACMRTVDILAEQFILPYYGLSGIEGLATGLPVMSNLTMDDYVQVLRRFSYLSECPVVATSPETLTDVLRRLVTNPALRATIGRASRAYAEKYHSYAMTRHLFGAIHRKLAGDATVDLMNLYHPLRSDYVRTNPIVHPLTQGNV
ncbi:MAG: hypothetical protein IT353_03575 [Gemmatimonadaceae bacterium]|nr:hypothetical protein [Gemmatimonadaceae bacterium]